MRFKIPPAVYHLRVCEGPLTVDDRPAGAVTHRRTILLAGDLHPTERSEALFDQLRRLWEQHHGPLRPEGIGAFATEYSRQLLAQGGEPALMRLQPDGTVDAGALESLGADPVGCECGRCGTKYTAWQIRNGAPEPDAASGKLVIPRAVDCEFCDLVMSWSEGATPAGTPNGRVVAGPTYGKSRGGTPV